MDKALDVRKQFRLQKVKQTEVITSPVHDNKVIAIQESMNNEESSEEESDN